MKENILYNRKIKFHDKENMLVISELQISDRNGYPEFSMCNERNGGSGQTSFVPQGEWQEKLNTIWDQYHLNGMNAGLPIQQEAITKWKAKGNEYNYEKICVYLKEIKLYEIPLKANLPKGFFISGKKKITNEETYKYGCGWIHCILPDDFTKTLNNVCNEIESEERERYAEADKVEWEDIKDEKIIALGKFLNIEPIEAQEDISKNDGKYSNDCEYSYSGIKYLVCTDAEADDLEDEYLDNYIEECMEMTDDVRRYFDDEKWKEDARKDGRGTSLSKYDGCENTKTVNDTIYFIYKQ